MAGNSNASSVYLNLEGNLSQALRDVERQVNNLNSSMNRLSQSRATDQMQNQFDSMNSHLSEIREGIGGIGSDIIGTIGKFAAWTVALVGIKDMTEKVFDFYKKGVQFNMDTQTATNGIAGLIASLNTVKENGKTLTGFDAFNASAVIAKQQVKELRIAAMQTSASVSEVTEAFQAGLAPGLQAGMNVDQVRNISVLVANTAKAMQMQKGQSQQELRALLSGDINQNAQIGTSLGLGPNGPLHQAYEQALKTGHAYEFLMDKMKSFKDAGLAQNDSLAGTMDSLSDGADMFAGQSSQSLTKQLTNLSTPVNSLFDNKTGDFSQSVNNISSVFDYIGNEAGQKIVSVVTKIVGLIKDFGDYIGKDKTLLTTFSLMWDDLKAAFSIISTLSLDILDGLKKCFEVFKELTGITDDQNEKMTAFQKTMATINVILLFLKGGFIFVKDTVSMIADTIALSLTQALVGVTVAIEKILVGFAKIASFAKMTSFSDSASKYADDLNKFNEATEKQIKQSETMKKISGQDGGFYADTKQFTSTINDQIKNIILNTAVNKSFKEYQDQKNKDDKADDQNKNIKLAPSNPPPKTRGGDLTQNMQALKAQVDAEKEIMDNRNKNLDIDYKYNLVSLQSYLDQKNKISVESYNSQLALINKEIEMNGVSLKNTQAGKTSNSLNEKQLSLLNQRKKLMDEFTTSQRSNALSDNKQLQDYSDKLSAINEKLLSMTGNKGQARIIKLNIDTRNIEQQYKSQPDSQSLISNYTTALKYQEEFNAAVDDYNDLLNSQNDKESLITANQNAGNISQLSAMSQIKSLRNDNIKQLDEQIKKMETIAKLSGNKELVSQLDKIKAGNVTLTASLDPLSKKLKDTFQDSAVSSLTDFISGTKTASEAFKEFANTITQMLLKLALNDMFTNMMSGGSSAAAGSTSGSSGFGAIFSSLGSLFSGARATGGTISKGGTYLVGENGPEVIQTNHDGFVSNSAATRAMMNQSNYQGSNNGGVTQNINFHVKDANSFINSKAQVQALLYKTVAQAKRNV